MTTWADYYLPRQLLLLSTLSALVRSVADRFPPQERGLGGAVQTCLAFVVDRQANTLNSLARWNTAGEKIEGVFARQALPLVWDFAEANSFSGATGDLDGAIEWVFKVAETNVAITHEGHAAQASATAHPLPDNAATAFITDPPYYYSVQYADLSDFFYVWLRRNLLSIHGSLLAAPLTPKEDEIIVQSPGQQFAPSGKNKVFYETRMLLAMAEGRRILCPSGIGVVVFAHTSTAGWEAQLQAMIEAGWIITGSWPIDTEMASRVISQNRSVLASSVHIIIRPREKPDGSVKIDEVGDWRDVLTELPHRIQDWMPRLADEGVVGADAIFACLGPALEIFSRYGRVEKANGQIVTLREYLEHVWAAVAKEALAVVFKGADASGFEEDARLTAVWLWTLSVGSEIDGADLEEQQDDDDSNPALPKGYVLEYDAARKLAQGLGAHLEELTSLIEIKGDEARLLPVAERTRRLFGKDEDQAPTSNKRKKAPQLQLGFVEELDQVEEAGAWGNKGIPRLGATVLDRVHQCMILFAAGRTEALRRFLIDEGVGKDERFWRLAQVLSYLYPKTSDEKRWIDGVLARKKGLGF
jgi:adenine-specific DNA methylase